MSDENNNGPTKETTTVQTPPGTPWTDPVRTTDSDYGPSPVADNE